MKKGVALLVVIVAIVVLGVLSFQNLTGKVVTSFNRCADSDGGSVFGVKGVVWGEYYGLEKDIFYSEDVCISDDVLVEYYCTGNPIDLDSRRESVNYKCSEKCEDGACIGEAEVGESYYGVDEGEELTLIEKLRRKFLI